MLPDLYISNFTVGSQTWNSDGSVQISIDVGNSGDADAFFNYIGVFLSTNPTVTTSDFLWFEDRTQPLLHPGETETTLNGFIPVNVKYTDLTPGVYFIAAIADYENVMPELNEGNNVSNIYQIRIRPEDPFTRFDDEVTLEYSGRYRAKSGDDIVYGTEGRDFIFGGTGHDEVYGAHGNDTLRGDAGDDILIGGRGRDHLTGGIGSDVFVFESATDSTVARADVISDFTTGRDKIDLSSISETLNLAQSVTFVETASGDTSVTVDLNSDGNAEMRITLLDTLGLSYSDFI